MSGNSFTFSSLTSSFFFCCEKALEQCYHEKNSSRLITFIMINSKYVILLMLINMFNVLKSLVSPEQDFYQLFPGGVIKTKQYSSLTLFLLLIIPPQKQKVKFHNQLLVRRIFSIGFNVKVYFIRLTSYL